MRKKTVMSVLLVLFSGFVILSAQTSGNNVIDLILKSYSAKVFSSEPVSESDIDLIVKCGIKAPSGRNMQPWKFIVVKDQALNGEIIQNITAGNILIIVCGQEKQDGTVDPLDCALATENMFIAAQALGLAARIYGGPVGNVNTNLKEKTGIPIGYRAVAILRLGKTDNNIDAVSAASARKNPGEVVIYK